MEKSARIVLVGSYALLIGNTVLGGVNEILCGANYAHDRKYSDADKKVSVSVLFTKTAVKSYGNALGNVSALAARAARGAAYLFINACGKHDRIDNLNYRLGNVFSSAAGLGEIAEAIRARRASEYTYVALATVKNDLFLYHCNSLKFLASSLTYASLKYKLYKKSYSNGIKAFVETNGIDIYIRPSYRRLFSAYVARSFYNIVTHIGKVDANVLKAIAVAAGVKYSVGFYADGLFSSARSTRKSVFSAV